MGISADRIARNEVGGSRLGERGTVVAIARASGHDLEAKTGVERGTRDPGVEVREIEPKMTR